MRRASATVIMRDALHDRGDQLVGVRLPFAGEMQVAHRGLQASVTEGMLDEANVHPGFQQVRLSSCGEGYGSRHGIA